MPKNPPKYRESSAEQRGTPCRPNLDQGAKLGQHKSKRSPKRHDNQQIERNTMNLFRSQLKKSFDVQSEKLRPLWIRVLLVAICAGWAIFELLVSQSIVWAVLAAGIAAYLFHQFFVAFDPPPRR